MASLVPCGGPARGISNRRIAIEILVLEQHVSKPMPLDDFRAVRIVLEPNDFAIGSEEPDPPPSDLISLETWRGITGLPDDVAIRTSDHSGSALAQIYALWSQWVTVTAESANALSDSMLDAGDDLQNSVFNALHGYYRSAFSSLRSVIEVMTIGTCGTFARNSRLYEDWRSGAAEFSFGSACDRLSSEPLLDGFNRELRKSGQSLFDAADRSRGLAAGHVRQWSAVSATIPIPGPVLLRATCGRAMDLSMYTRPSENGIALGCTPFRSAQY
jgi:hypothetical protein